MRNWRHLAGYYNTRRRGDTVVLRADKKSYTITAASGAPACDNKYTLTGADGSVKYVDAIEEFIVPKSFVYPGGR